MSTAKMRVCLTVVRPNGSAFVSACVYLYLYLTACLCEYASVYVCVSIMWEMRMWSLRWHINVAFNNTKDSITHSHFKIVFHTRTLHTHTLKHTQPLERPKSPRVERVSRTIRSTLPLSVSLFQFLCAFFYYLLLYWALPLGVGNGRGSGRGQCVDSCHWKLATFSFFSYALFYLHAVCIKMI